MRSLQVALLTLSQASSALAFLHPTPQALGCARGGGDRSSRPPGTVGLQMMVASAPASTVNAPAAAAAINGGAGVVDRSGGTEASSLEGKAVEGVGEELRTVEMYDTTLRDGTQMEGISASVNDKLKIARQLAGFGGFVLGEKQDWSSVVVLLRLKNWLEIEIAAVPSVPV